jgi:hypothetical protein
MRDKLPITAHAGITAIEHGGVERVLGMLTPIDVLNWSAYSSHPSRGGCIPAGILCTHTHFAMCVRMPR